MGCFYPLVCVCLVVSHNISPKRERKRASPLGERYKHVYLPEGCQSGPPHNYIKQHPSLPPLAKPRALLKLMITEVCSHAARKDRSA